MHIAKRLLCAGIALSLWAQAAHAQQAAPVKLTEDAKTWTLDNGIVRAQVAKESGDLVSMKYKNLEMLASFLKEDGTADLEKDKPGHNFEGINRGMTDHQYGFWSHDAMGQRGSGDAIPSITIDPKTNSGARAEVAVKGIANGRKMGTGPGANGGNFISDIEIRWALGQGESGVYTYCVFEHPANYAASSITEARFCAKLADSFDWMSVAQSPHHDKHYPKTLREGDKYVYTTNQTKNPAFGWSSTTNKVGFFLINPSMEYMSGGPTKVEFLGHRDTNQIAAPCVLNYWRSSHYGGADVTVGEGEAWSKVIGPFMLYVNSGDTPEAIYANAREMAAKEKHAWPYDWAKHPAYATSKQRAEVTGQLVVSDPQRTGNTLPNLFVGLTAADYSVGGPGNRMVGWQQDGKNYQYWAKGNPDGTFTVPDVRPGKYTLRAFADGVLGELAQADVVVTEGKNLNLGKVTWSPVRKGKQLFEVGVANRYGSEFFKAENYWSPTVAQDYATLFPEDINFVVGKSDPAKDWYIAHVPHYEPAATPPVAPPAAAPPAAPRANPAANPEAGGAGAAQGAGGQGRGGPGAGGPGRGGPGARGGGGFGFGGPAANGRAAPRTITFEITSAPRGKATLRIAMSGSAVRTIPVKVNGQDAGVIGPFANDGAISRHGNHGIWNEKELEFNASLLRSGQNTVTLTIPAGPVNNGVIYDYIRLELDENATVAAAQ